MLGFSFGWVMLAVVVFMPVGYLIMYGLTRFDAWRFGKKIPQHKVLVNVLLCLIFAFVSGGILQHFWNEIDGCMQEGSTLGSCIFLLKAN